MFGFSFVKSVAEKIDGVLRPTISANAQTIDKLQLILSTKRKNTGLLDNFKVLNSAAYFFFRIFNDWRASTSILESETFMGSFVSPRNKTHESVTLPVGRDRKILPALRPNQIAVFVTVPSWEKIINAFFFFFS